MAQSNEGEKKVANVYVVSPEDDRIELGRTENAISLAVIPFLGNVCLVYLNQETDPRLIIDDNLVNLDLKVERFASDRDAFVAATSIISDFLKTEERDEEGNDADQTKEVRLTVCNRLHPHEMTHDQNAAFQVMVESLGTISLHALLEVLLSNNGHEE